ncbi:hypothetical protein H2201_008537 [Coniosporium apollinis]|uniref:Ubiquitin 3 binding protein But2 C-terminal domain-containing protein n=1 Tax=Coniosporium apollinis TaxID=61459 RepID=A0ABQ9NGH2_9PEZI|nr:hypothetical protein H2201_008537 [Coniosporium apollinis]
MKTPLTALSFALSASALTLRQSPCCFHLTATGGPSGPLGQLSDGQNRIGQGSPPSTYCISADGGLTDHSGRGCILTGPTTQFQCDTGAGATPGFSVGCDGMLVYNGMAKFVACPTGDQGGFNVYVRAPQGQGGCVDVMLAADSCKAGCPSPAAAPTQKSCPPNLSGIWEFPHLIIPIDASNPTKAYGTSYNGHISSNKSAIFNFDFPPSLAGKTCTLIFLLPTQDKLVTSSFTLSGSGEVVFARLEKPATEATSWGNMPGAEEEFGVARLRPGESYVVASFACPAGEREGFVMGAKLPSADPINLEWFQDWNPEAVGLYISAC